MEEEIPKEIIENSPGRMYGKKAEGTFKCHFCKRKLPLPLLADGSGDTCIRCFINLLETTENEDGDAIGLKVRPRIQKDANTQAEVMEIDDLEKQFGVTPPKLPKEKKKQLMEAGKRFMKNLRRGSPDAFPYHLRGGGQPEGQNEGEEKSEIS